jgi:uncharacterized membrane protein
VLLAAVNSDRYYLLLTLHIVAVVIGFGSVFLNGVYASRANRIGGSEGVAISEAVSDLARKWAAPFQYAVFVLGVLLVLDSDVPVRHQNAWTFGQVWLSLSMVIYLAIITLEHAVYRPNEKQMIALQRELLELRPIPAGGTPPQVAELERRSIRAGIIGTALDLGVVVIIGLMIWKPAV